jgi:hypothetical protein
MMCWNKHVKFFKLTKVEHIYGVAHWLKNWFIIGEVKGSIPKIITYEHA